MKPASWRDAIRNIDEAIGIKSRKISKNRGLHQLRVELCNAIDLVTSNDGQVRHTNTFSMILIDDRDPAEKIFVMGISQKHGCQEPPINLKNDLKMSWQQSTQ